MNSRTELLEQLARHAYKYDSAEGFLLVSGKRSPEYLDCRQALSRPAAMAALGRVMIQEVSPHAVALGGLTLGADPIAMSASQASAETNQPLRWFTVRKEPKAHGRKKLIEGAVEPGESVTVVDDVVTSGQSTLKAIAACREEGLTVAQVLVLVDREESDGMAAIRREVGGLAVRAIFTKSEIKARWQALHGEPGGAESAQRSGSARRPSPR